MTDENLPLGPKTLNEKYRDRGHVEEWAVQPAADPCVGNLATPVNSGYFVKALVNNLPLYREGISANFRGLETGAAIGYFIYGPFLVMGPLRTTDFATTAALLATVGAVHILTALLVLYNVPGKAPTVPPRTSLLPTLLPTCSQGKAGPTSPVAFGWVAARAQPLHGSYATLCTCNHC